MRDYTFHTLNDKEFEKIAGDLLQKELGLRLESFKSGRDQGIDLRYAVSMENPNEIVVQAKHWLKSGFQKLYNHLATKELPKIRTLNPTRYIVVTSVGLTPANKEKIATSLSPYVLSTSDIYGLDDLNNLLGKFPDVEAAHYKLWISSVAVTQLLLNNAVIGRSRYIADEIDRKSCLFVPTMAYARAVHILNNKRVILIKGVPGVGKTTLAEFLLYQLIKDGFELVVIGENIRDAEDVFDPSKKQAFYFDDFLGSNYLEIMHGRGSGTQILSFVERVRRQKNKRLILTTRTTILNQATTQLSNLSSSSLRANEFELNLNDYSRLDKAKILYNHLYFSSADPEFFDILFEDKNYLRIVDHPNYNPRIVEFLTDANRIDDVGREDYLAFVLQNLEHPEEIWEHSFTRQIDAYAQILVVTLFSLGMSAPADVLQRAYTSRIDYEVAQGGLQRMLNPFNTSVRLLLGGFLNHQIAHGAEGKYTFVNPSIVDFLISYLSRDQEEKWRVINAAVFTEQFTTRFPLNDGEGITISESDQGKLLDRIWPLRTVLISHRGHNRDLELAHYLRPQVGKGLVESRFAEIVRDIDFESLTCLDFGNLVSLLGESPESGYLNVLSDVWDEGAVALFGIADEMSEFDEIIALFRIVHKNLSDWISIGERRIIVQQRVDSFWEASLSSEIEKDEGLNVFLEADEFAPVLESFRERISSLNNRLCIDQSPEFEAIDRIDSYELMSENRDRARAEDYQADHWKEEYYERKQEEAAIVNLFSR